MQSPPTSRLRPRAFFPILIGGIAGTLIWLAFAGFDVRKEGWDDPAWFTVGMPLLGVVCFGLGWLAPLRAWRWGIAPMAAAAAVAVAGNPSANLLPLGLVLFAVLALPCMGAAALGAFLRRQLGRRQLARVR